MRRTLALLFALTLFVPLAACGGDDDDAGSSSGSGSGSASGTEDDDNNNDEESGDDLDDFCAEVEEVAESGFDDLVSSDDPDDLEEAGDLLAELSESAPDELEDTFAELDDGFDLLVELAQEVADGADEGQVFEENEEALTDFGELADEVDEFTLEECGITVDGDTEADDADDSSGDSTDTQEAGDPDEPPSIDDAELEELAEECFDGSGSACDELFFAADSGSEAEDYGNTCGGRFDGSPGLCSTAIGD